MNKTLLLFTMLSIFTVLQLKSQNVNFAQVGKVRLLGKTKPLIELPASTKPMGKLSNKARNRVNKPSVPNFTGNTQMPTPFAGTALPHGPDPLVQNDAGSRASFQVIPALVFDGIDENDSGIYPPDPSGYIGTNHYLQTTNHSNGTVFEIFDKDGQTVYGPANTAPFWQEFNITGFGDPVVVYDHEFDRWMITEFGPFGTTVFLIAVSETSDPLGAWYAYEFQTPSFPDYPKYSVWNNSYLVTSNEGDPEIPVYAINRSQLLAGEENVDMVRLPALPKFQAIDAFQVATPVSWDGTIPPPANEPGYVVRIYDDAWEGGSDGLELWKIHIDWNSPGDSYTEGPIFLQTAPFDSKICNTSIFDCIAQPDGSTISVLEQVIMHRAQYRNFGSHESIVLNHVVDVSGNDQAGIRWYELRRVGTGPWAIYQEGTWSPDGDHRFMGSISMDFVGNILLAYSVTGPDQLLSLRFTGRLANDPLGEMTIDEYEFGTGLSLNPLFRWGDYSCMTLDPIDQRTFWFTGEYMMDNGLWGTKIMKAYIKRDTNDVGPQALVQPQSSGYLTNAESFKVVLRNFGYAAASNFDVSLMVNGNLIATEPITSTIQPDSVLSHTFTPTVDMSAIGAYTIKIFTSYSLDTLFTNDTLRTVVYQLPRNDASINGFTGLDFPICDSVLTAGIILGNSGVDTLYSAVINYQINGGLTNTINWTGAIPPGGSEVVTITSTAVQAGDNSLLVFVEQPNGLPDENNSNDQRTTNFTIVAEGTGIVLQLLTDNYPNETTWELKDENGNILFTGGPYDDPQTLYTVPMCIQEGCYTFSIFDSFGDGMFWPADGIAGNYVIFNSAGVPIANLYDPAFGTEDNNDFCTDGSCLMVLTASVNNVSSAGATDGSALITSDNGVAPFQYSINDGQTYQTSPLFLNLAEGTYYYIIKDASGCTMRDSFFVGTCILEANVSFTQPATSVSEDGSIEVQVTAGYPPFSYRLSPNGFQGDPVFSNLDEGVYTVQVADSIGCTQTFSLAIGAITGTLNKVLNSNLKVYPNPTNGTFTIELDGNSSYDVVPFTIYNAEGKPVLHHRLAPFNGMLSAQVSLKAFPAGSYYLRVLDAKAGINQLLKVVKQ